MNELNPPQKEAVLHKDGPLMVLAGAGSGKTKMLTSRIAYLIEAHGVDPREILAVTFTNKAAQEMRERVQKLLSLGVYSPEIGTFHSICVRILRREMEFTPFQKPFVIYDDLDQLSLIKSVHHKMDLDEKKYPPKVLQGTLNRFKCDAIEASHLSPDTQDAKFIDFYRLYQENLFSNQALDFGEILCLTYRLLRDNVELRRKYQNVFRFIHVDEYQDTNRAQYLLLSALTARAQGGHQNICVVGDEDQSIYKWRGADIGNILNFERDFPGAKIIKLEQNYRSTKTIISAASHLIQHNRLRKDKKLWTANEDGMPILRVQFSDERAEAEKVVSEIKRLSQNEGYAFSDFAVFYRTHAQSRQFEDVLRREKINYKIVGGLRFYDRKEIKDILSYFKVILNPLDSVSLKRIINVPGRGIGKVTLEKLQSVSQTQSLWSALENPTGLDFSSGTEKKISDFVALIKKLTQEQTCLKLSELYGLLLDETHYVQELKQEGTIEAAARIENLEEFSSVLQEFEDEHLKKLSLKELLPLFLEQASLSTEEGKAENASILSIQMMTLHSSKGLEFPVVFMVGMEEGLFPSLRVWQDEEDESEIEEERRLCYVGMTRAKERLYLFHVERRRIWGNVLVQTPARFFSEIPEQYVDFKDMSYERRLTQSFEMPRTRKMEEDFVGRKIDHPDYGPGVIVMSEGSGENQKVTLEFRNRGRKKFLLRYLDLSFLRISIF